MYEIYLVSITWRAGLRNGVKKKGFPENSSNFAPGFWE